MNRLDFSRPPFPSQSQNTNDLILKPFIWPESCTQESNKKRGREVTALSIGTSKKQSSFGPTPFFLSRLTETLVFHANCDVVASFPFSLKQSKH